MRQADRQWEVFILQDMSEKDLRTLSTLQNPLFHLHLFPHSYPLIKQPFTLESVLENLGLYDMDVGRVKDALSVRAMFFLSYNTADSFPGSGMSLAYHQKQHCTPDQSMYAVRIHQKTRTSIPYQISQQGFASRLKSHLWHFHASAVKNTFDH